MTVVREFTNVPEVEAGELSERGLRIFVDRIAAYPRSRIGMSELWAALAEAFPRRPTGAAERAWLLAALEHARGHGVIELPVAHGRRWDRVASPAVPTEVTRVRSQQLHPTPAWRTDVWHPALQWVPVLNRVTAEEYRFLRRVHEGLVQNAFRTAAPFKHRSLALTGHEKRLGDLVTGRLFEQGRLTLELIGAVREVPPLAWTVVRPSTAPRILVFENAGPSDLAIALLAQVNNAAYDIVAFGGGRTFPVAVRRLAALNPSSIAYVGDLDFDGLAIAEAAAAAADVAALPPVVPAQGIHAAMLHAASRLGSPTGWPVNERKRVQSVARVPRQVFAWLPSSIRVEAARVVNAGHRIPEEALSPDSMRDVLRA